MKVGSIQQSNADVIVMRNGNQVILNPGDDVYSGDRIMSSNGFTRVKIDALYTGQGNSYIEMKDGGIAHIIYDTSLNKVAVQTNDKAECDGLVEVYALDDDPTVAAIVDGYGEEESQQDEGSEVLLGALLIGGGILAAGSSIDSVSGGSGVSDTNEPDPEEPMTGGPGPIPITIPTPITPGEPDPEQPMTGGPGPVPGPTSGEEGSGVAGLVDAIGEQLGSTDNELTGGLGNTLEGVAGGLENVGETLLVGSPLEPISEITGTLIGTDNTADTNNGLGGVIGAVDALGDSLDTGTDGTFLEPIGDLANTLVGSTLTGNPEQGLVSDVLIAVDEGIVSAIGSTPLEPVSTLVDQILLGNTGFSS